MIIIIMREILALWLLDLVLWVAPKDLEQKLGMAIIKALESHATALKKEV